jgi:hypothetical protein
MPPSFEAQPTYQEYPKMRYHRTGKNAVVNDREAELGLGEGWGGSPDGPFGLQEGNPLQWLDEWGLECLVTAARDRIREALTDAHANVIESGADHDSKVRRASMKKLFDVIAAECLDAGLLTESMLNDTIPRIVYDAAVSGRWQTGSLEKNSNCTLQYGHHWVQHDVPRMLAAMFESQVWRWRGKLGRQSGTQEPIAEPRPFATAGTQAPKMDRKAEMRSRRNENYENIDRALRSISDACPKNQEEVFHFLDKRDIRMPNREPFKTARGWLKGFRQNPQQARVWLSQAWKRLGLPPFPPGPKK